VLLVVVALVPWLPVLALGAYLEYTIYRASSRAEARRMPRPATAGSGASWPSADEKAGD
jgi:hypothetical protein